MYFPTLKNPIVIPQFKNILIISRIYLSVKIFSSENSTSWNFIIPRNPKKSRKYRHFRQFWELQNSQKFSDVPKFTNSENSTSYNFILLRNPENLENTVLFDNSESFWILKNSRQSRNSRILRSLLLIIS